MIDQNSTESVSRRSFLEAASVGSVLALALGSTPADATAQSRQGAGATTMPGLSEDLKAEFDEYGYIVLRELISRQDALRLAERVKEIMSRRPDVDKLDQHLPGFFNQIEPADDPLFLPLVTQPACYELAKALLGEGFQMTEVGCRWRKPGAPAGPAHITRPIDSFARSGLPIPNVCFVVAFSWMLNDLTRDMGATYYLPFSQHAPRGPRAGVEYQHRVDVEAPAGSVLIHHGGIWHGFGANETKDRARVGLMGGYFPAWMDPVSVGWQPMKRSVRDRMPPLVQLMNRHVSDD